MNSPAILTEFDMIIRLSLSFLAGAIIGFERSSRRQIVGLRTHILISTGSTLLMLLSIYLTQYYSLSGNGDPGRIAAQVVSGIGFLGAGAIIRLGNNIRGLTTAASLWFIAAVGLAIGSGMFLISGVTVTFGLITLFVLNKVERKIFPVEHYKMMEISFKENIQSTKETVEIIKEAGIGIQFIDVNQSTKTNQTKLRLLVSIPDSTDIASLARAIKASGNVGKVEIKEKY